MVKKNTPATEDQETAAAETVDNETGEVVNASENLPVIGSETGSEIMIGGRKITVKKQVTLPLLKHEEGQIRYVTILKAIYEGKEIKNKRGGETEMAPATMALVTDLETGRQCEYIVNAVFKGIMEDDYPSDSYVGKSFAINKLEKPKGKRYNALEILEVEIE
jgi:malate/lactate dehydrogenase